MRSTPIVNPASTIMIIDVRLKTGTLLLMFGNNVLKVDKGVRS